MYMCASPLIEMCLSFNRCVYDVGCKAYIYQKTRIRNCLLIDTKCGDFGKTFHITPDFIINRKGGFNVNRGTNIRYLSNYM